MARKELPFSERTTWKRVEDMQQYGGLLANTVRQFLKHREHWGKPQMQELMASQLGDALKDYENATGYDL